MNSLSPVMHPLERRFTATCGSQIGCLAIVPRKQGTRCPRRAVENIAGRWPCRVDKTPRARDTACFSFEALVGFEILPDCGTVAV